MCHVGPFEDGAPTCDLNRLHCQTVLYDHRRKPWLMKSARWPVRRNLCCNSWAAASSLAGSEHSWNAPKLCIDLPTLRQLKCSQYLCFEHSLEGVPFSAKWNAAEIQSCGCSRVIVLRNVLMPATPKRSCREVV